MSTIVVLSANQPADRPYSGGAQIAEFRGTTSTEDHVPEDWIASTTPLFGQDRLGLTALPDGRLLADAIRADPVWWLGRDHVQAFGADPRLLTKLLDAGERLFVHAHPDDPFATAHHFANGKSEAWFVLTGGTVHLGLREPVSTGKLLQLAMDQDIERLLGLLHETRVEPGDVVAVPPGVLHAIGAGVFVVELQQAADLSILLEWQGFPVDGLADGNLGLGLDVAIQAVETRGRGDLTDLIRPAGFGPSVLPRSVDRYLRLERRRITDRAVIEQGFSVLIVVAGEVRTQDVTLSRGATAVVPYAAGSLKLTGNGEVLFARPPPP
ncbi:MAG: class I mannose-6-phosphate isomerase [bacterium]